MERTLNAIVGNNNTTYLLYVKIPLPLTIYVQKYLARVVLFNSLETISSVYRTNTIASTDHVGTLTKETTDKRLLLLVVEKCT